MRGLGSQFGYANNTRRVCWETRLHCFDMFTCRLEQGHVSSPGLADILEVSSFYAMGRRRPI